MNWHEYRVIKTKWFGTHRFEIVDQNGKRFRSKSASSDKRVKRIMDKSSIIKRQYQACTKSTIYEMLYRGE